MEQKNDERDQAGLRSSLIFLAVLIAWGLLIALTGWQWTDAVS